MHIPHQTESHNRTNSLTEYVVSSDIETCKNEQLSYWFDYNGKYNKPQKFNLVWIPTYTINYFSKIKLTINNLVKFDNSMIIKKMCVIDYFISKQYL